MNDQSSVSPMDSPDSEDFQDNSYYSQSSTNVNVPVVDHFQQPEISQPLIQK